MLRAARRNVFGHKIRLLLTAFSVVLGVAFVAGTLVLTDAMSDTFNAIADRTQTNDVYVRGVEDKTAQPSPTTGEQRTLLPLSLQDEIKQVPGVASVQPDLQGTAILIKQNGKAAVNGGAPTFGFNWTGNDRAWRLVSGRGPTSSSEVAVDKDTLSLAKLKVGDSTRVVIDGQPIPVTIVGSVEAPGTSGLAGATATFFDPASALKYFAEDGKISDFAVNASSGVSPAQLRDNVAKALPQVSVVTGDQAAKETRDQIAKGLGFFKTFLLVFAGIALFVGAFVIMNTFSMLVAQRTRELALLRALGASRRQVTRSVLVEAFIVGTVSSVIGLGLGVVIAAGLKALLSAAGLKIGSQLPVDTSTVIWSFAIGIIVTCVAAYFPARRAAKVPPVAAMRDDVALPSRSLVVRAVVGLAMLAIGVVLTVLGLNGVFTHSGPITGLGAGLTVLGAIVLAPLVAPPVLGVIGLPLAWVFGPAGRLARGNSMRNPRRSAATASALMIGLALVTGISVLAASVHATLAKTYKTDLTAQYALTGVSGNLVPSSVADGARKIPGVAHVAEYASVPLIINGEQDSAIAAVGADLVTAQHVDITQGSVAALDQGQILVSTKQAESEHWHLGQTLSGRFGAHPQSMTIGGIYSNDGILGGLVVPRSWYEAAVPAGQRENIAIAVVTSSGQTSDQVRAALDTLTKPYAVVQVQTRDEFIKSQEGQVNFLLDILYALLGMAIIIAIFGIINTLALSIFERTREIGLLRAVGMGRRQLRRVVRLESVSISVFGALLGIVLGLFFGISLQQAISDDGVSELSVPVVRLIVFLILAALAGVFAAIWPARRAAKLDVLKAITTE